MNFDPTTLSIIAICISIVGLLIGLYNTAVDRYIKHKQVDLQIEQIKGQILTRLTLWIIETRDHAIEILKLSSQEHDEAWEIAGRLAKLHKDICEFHAKVDASPTSTATRTGALPMIQVVLNKLDETVPYYDKLRKDVSARNLKEIALCLDAIVGDSEEEESD